MDEREVENTPKMAVPDVAEEPSPEQRHQNKEVEQQLQALNVFLEPWLETKETVRERIATSLGPETVASLHGTLDRDVRRQEQAHQQPWSLSHADSLLHRVSFSFLGRPMKEILASLDGATVIGDTVASRVLPEFSSPGHADAGKETRTSWSPLATLEGNQRVHEVSVSVLQMEVEDLQRDLQAARRDQGRGAAGTVDRLERTLRQAQAERGGREAELRARRTREDAQVITSGQTEYLKFIEWRALVDLGSVDSGLTTQQVEQIEAVNLEEWKKFYTALGTELAESKKVVAQNGRAAESEQSAETQVLNRLWTFITQEAQRYFLAAEQARKRLEEQRDVAPRVGQEPPRELDFTQRHIREARAKLDVKPARRSEKEMTQLALDYQRNMDMFYRVVEAQLALSAPWIARPDELRAVLKQLARIPSPPQPDRREVPRAA